MSSSEGRILGRYRLERLVGRGGMAEVWEARDQVLGRRVAVKIILDNLAAQERFHERFLSEARSVAALEHENVLPIYDFGDAGGEPYLVMPFLEGGTLADRLRRGEVGAAQAIDWIRQLASALDAAHAAGVLHRDVKPANVMIGGNGRLLLADFGIAKSTQGGDLTATGIALGTPAYMAPELARGEPATTSSDRYALGVLAYELLCGRPPFVGDNALALLHQHLTTPVPAVGGARPDLPHDLDPAFARILSKEPNERPPSGAALAADIERAFGAGDSMAATDTGRRAVESPGREDRTLAAPVSPSPGTAATNRLAPPARAAAGGAGATAFTAATAAVTRPAAPPASVADAATPATAARRGRRTALIATAGVALALAIALIWWPARDRSDDTVAPVSIPAEGSLAQLGDRRGDDADVATAPSEAADDLGRDETAAPPAGPAGSPTAAAGSALGSSPALPGAPDSPPATSGQSIDADRAASMPAAPDAPEAPDLDPATAEQAASLGSEVPASTGRWALPPQDAFAIFSLVGTAWRRGRFPPTLFDEVERRAATLPPASENPGVELLASWVDGGQALARGDRESARASVESFFAIPNPPDWTTLLPARFLARHPGPPSDWQVALFWADPRNELRPLVDTALRAAPNDRNLLMARAVVEHLDGHHAEAARQAIALEPQLRLPQARRAMVRFVGDQLLWSGDSAAAISWYKKLLVAPDRTEVGAVLRTLSHEGGPQLVARACAAQFMPACETGRSTPAQRARRTRPQP